MKKEITFSDIIDNHIKNIQYILNPENKNYYNQFIENLEKIKSIEGLQNFSFINHIKIMLENLIKYKEQIINISKKNFNKNYYTCDFSYNGERTGYTYGEINGICINAFPKFLNYFIDDNGEKHWLIFYGPNIGFCKGNPFQYKKNMPHKGYCSDFDINKMLNTIDLAELYKKQNITSTSTSSESDITSTTSTNTSTSTSSESDITSTNPHNNSSFENFDELNTIFDIVFDNLYNKNNSSTNTSTSTNTYTSASSEPDITSTNPHNNNFYELNTIPDIVSDNLYNNNNSSTNISTTTNTSTSASSEPDITSTKFFTNASKEINNIFYPKNTTNSRHNSNLYNSTSFIESQNNSNSLNSTSSILLIGLCTGGFIILLIFAICLCYKHFKNTKPKTTMNVNDYKTVSTQENQNEV